MSLADLDVLLVDCQTTGATPRDGHLLEIAWCRTRADPAPPADAIVAHLVELPEGATIPPRVTRLTGITAEDLARASPPARVWTELVAAASSARPIAHFARFEDAFLRALLLRATPNATFPLALLCTHRIARHLLPELPRRTLRALAGHFGHGAAENKRAAEHVRLTAVVWRGLVELLAGRGVTSLEQLQVLLAAPFPAPRPPAFKMNRAARLALPDRPGIYRMRGAGEQVLYVGKATSLRHRVNSYFQKRRGHAERTLELLSVVRDIEVEVCPSALEAALREHDEIKGLEPPYNRALRRRPDGPFFVSRDLLEDAAAPDDDHPLGPLTSIAGPRAVGLLAALEGSRVPDERIRAAIVGDDVERGPGLDVLAGGIEACAAQGLGSMPWSAAALLALGDRLWRQRLAEAPVDADLEPTDLVLVSQRAEPRTWSTGSVRARLDELILDTARALRRSRWQCWLSDATLTWRAAAGDERRIRLRRGQVAEPDPGADRGLAWRERQASLDQATCDRLRVLTTELRRLLLSERPVELRLRPRVVLGNAGLARALRWI